MYKKEERIWVIRSTQMNLAHNNKSCMIELSLRRDSMSIFVVRLKLWKQHLIENSWRN